MAETRTRTSSRKAASRPASAPAHKAAPLTVPERARKFQRGAIKRLETLLAATDLSSCTSEPFATVWAEVLSLIEQYQRAIVDASGMTASCGKGCAACCCHWVEDVNSFEAEIIAADLRRRHGPAIPRILRQCREDNERLQRLNVLVEQKLSETRRALNEEIDPVDLLLASFYQLSLECPLLENGECMVYVVRPLTCRMYVSFSDPIRCHPEYINVGKTPTYLFDPGKKANDLIDKLHFKFQKFEGDTGLRSLLIKYLS